MQSFETPSTTTKSYQNLTDSSEIVNSKEKDEVRCGLGCYLLIIGLPCVLVLIILIFLMVLCFGKRSDKNMLVQRDPESTSDYSDPPPIHQSLQAQRTQYRLDQLKSYIDDKWEVERSQVTLDEIIGEGEFGRVYKGSAKDLPDTPGVISVAVKTLKGDANVSELQALLSECQLLQDVQHANVIRLLGVCKNGNQPPLMIIDFCRFGSLK